MMSELLMRLNGQQIYGQRAAVACRQPNCLYTRLYAIYRMLNIVYVYRIYKRYTSLLGRLSMLLIRTCDRRRNIFTLFELSQQLTLQVFKYLPQLWHVACVGYCPLLWQDTSTAAARQINENFKYATRLCPD